MNLPKAWLFLAALLAGLLLASCGSAPQASAPTATYWAQRARENATQAAIRLQASGSQRRAQETLAAAQAQQQAAEAEATEQAYLAQARAWPVLWEAAYEDEEAGWEVGSEEDPLGKASWEISGGKYRWKVQAQDSLVWWITPELGALTDFYLSVEAFLASGPADAESALIFRETGENDYYYLAIDNQGQYCLYLHAQGEWTVLVPWAGFSGLKPGETNRLSVVAQGAQIDLYFNDRLAARVTDGSLTEGKVGIAVGLSSPLDSGTWEFDNFEVRSLFPPAPLPEETAGAPGLPTQQP